MRLIVKTGDVLDEAVDVLICTANPTLTMSGGVNGALLERGGLEIQDELRRHLAEHRKNWVEPGSIVRTGPGPLPVKHILHAVGVSALYESSTDLVACTLDRALRIAADLGARSVATPAIATGYGPLTIEDFVSALKKIAYCPYSPIEELRVVLRHEDQTQTVAAMMGCQRSTLQHPESDGARLI